MYGSGFRVPGLQLGDERMRGQRVGLRIFGVYTMGSFRVTMGLTGSPAPYYSFLLAASSMSYLEKHERAVLEGTTWNQHLQPRIEKKIMCQSLRPSYPQQEKAE